MNSTIAISLGFTFGLLATSALAGGDVAAGKKKSTACQVCHGPTGNSTDPQYPRLAGQHASYLIKALEDYQSGARQNPIMAGFSAPLTDEDRKDLAAFFANQDGGLSIISRSE